MIKTLFTNPVPVYCPRDTVHLINLEYYFLRKYCAFDGTNETVLYLCLLETDGFKGDLTKKRVLLCSARQKDTNWQIEKLMLPEVAIFF